MKTLSGICQDYQASLKDDRPILCEYVITPHGIVKLEDPGISCEMQCEWCGGTACYTPLFDPNISAAKCWLCANHNCDVYKRKTHSRMTTTITKPTRALEWPLFCEINGLGDINHEVKFENVDQSQGKISYMLKFVATPRGILHMQGEPGTGKTFAALAMCELYTRKDSSCIFTTQKQMSNQWLETFNKDRYNNYIERITECKLLVIDDFGTADVAAGFMAFFMDLLNSRLQWTTRGTVITTNLKADKFALYCGDALSDRINTGQLFEFKGKTRRKPNVL